jgi:putative ABC transport system substrate-binding protein
MLERRRTATTGHARAAFNIPRAGVAWPDLIRRRGESVVARRKFMCMAAAGVFAMPLAASAQQPAKVYRIGVLEPVTSPEYAHRMDVFRQALRELGRTNGYAVTFEERSANGHYERLPRLAAELVALKVDVIFTIGGTPSIEAAMKATQTIPIVFPTVGDAVAEKFAQSMAHPGGNATGLTNMGAELYSKRLALLKEAVPHITNVALLVNGGNAYTSQVIPLAKAASGSIGIQLQVFDVRAPEEYKKTLGSMAASGIQGVVVAEDAALIGNIKQLGELALEYRLPLVAAASENGVLAAYSRDADSNYRRAAAYVDKILKGARPGDLPIEQPTNFILIVNLKTAKALGLTIPQSLLLRADEVIQ